MQICCQDLFFSRARSTDAAHTLVNGGTTNGKSPLEKAFQAVTTMTQRTNVVSELVNIKVTSINDVDYSPKVSLHKNHSMIVTQLLVPTLPERLP
jgi:hypothetical protein